MLFRDRDEAARLLADVLLNLRAERPLVLGVAAGGVLVARTVAERLGAPLALAPSPAPDAGARLELDSLAGRTVLVVDEGVCTGATMRAALEAVAIAGPKRVIAAAPVAPKRLSLDRLASDLYAVARPDPVGSIRRWYAELPEVSPDEVQAALSGPTGQDWAYAGATSL